MQMTRLQSMIEKIVILGFKSAFERLLCHTHACPETEFLMLYDDIIRLIFSTVGVSWGGADIFLGLVHHVRDSGVEGAAIQRGKYKIHEGIERYSSGGDDALYMQQCMKIIPLEAPTEIRIRSFVPISIFFWRWSRTWHT